MTFNSAPWAIDGARSAAGLARLASYAGGSGRSGIIQPSDLRVTALAVPGNGVEIGSGGATILNYYLSNPDEAYVASNPAPHTVLAADMPSPQPSVQHYLVCVVVGDPAFDQTGHPFMPSGPLDPAVAPDFEYVRVVIIPCPNGTTSFEDLGYNYPAYALARLEVPANTSTITNAMIVDLRELASPRESTRLLLAQPQGTPDSGTRFQSTSFQTINGWAPVVQIPKWCTYISAVGRIEGISHIDPDLVGASRVRIGNIAGAETFHELPDTNGGGERVNLTGIWAADVSAWAGTSQEVTVEIRRISGSGFLVAYYDATVTIDLRFSERPI